MNKNNKTVSALLVTALVTNNSSIMALANETNLIEANKINSINKEKDFWYKTLLFKKNSYTNYT